MSDAIRGFFGDYRWLSNFWKVDVEYEGYVYPSVEHAYQAAKSTDHRVRQRLCDPNISPGQAKRMGRTFTLRTDWEDVKVDIMEQLLRSKFQDESLREKLLATGDLEIVEENTWNDTFWGICKGYGQNMLGKLIMLARKELSQEAS